MHASLADLLTLRDDEPIAAEVRSHVDGCDACRRRLDDLAATRDALKALPPLPPTDSLWERIERCAQQAPTRQRRRQRWMAVGVAATVLIAAGSAWLIAGGGKTAPTPRRVTIARAETPSVNTLRQRSTQLEAILRRLRTHDAMMSARTANTIANLEDSVAAVDYRLDQGAARGMTADEARRLWSRRVGLMRSLVTVRYVQAAGQ